MKSPCVHNHNGDKSYKTLQEIWAPQIVPEISSESFFMPSSVAMVTAAVRAEFHSSPASSMLSSEMAICVMLPKSSALKGRPVNFMKKVTAILFLRQSKRSCYLNYGLLPEGPYIKI